MEISMLVVYADGMYIVHLYIGYTHVPFTKQGI